VIGKKPQHSVATFYEKHRDNPSAIAEYLNSALSTGDSVAIAKAIGNMVHAQGVARFAQKALASVVGRMEVVILSDPNA
jgi:DNA-binding phage protein